MWVNFKINIDWGLKVSNESDFMKKIAETYTSQYKYIYNCSMKKYVH